MLDGTSREQTMLGGSNRKIIRTDRTLPTEHEAINRREYPGTRQLCERCGEPTERCEEDAIYTDSGEGPLCVGCYDTANRAICLKEGT